MDSSPDIPDVKSIDSGTVLSVLQPITNAISISEEEANKPPGVDAAYSSSSDVFPPSSKVPLVAGKFEVIRVVVPEVPAKTVTIQAPGEHVATPCAPAAEERDKLSLEHSDSVASSAQPPKPPLLKGEEEEEDEESDEDKNNRHRVVEISPCSRYHKRRERVLQREVPGIDAAFLAMDTEEGREVVWNEVQFSEKKNFKEKEEQIHQIFDNLINLHHPSILKFLRWWTDVDVNSEKPRVIFITEHISSGSLNHFIKTSKHSKTAPNGNAVHMPEKSWKRWSRQILTALNYLHTCKPPIVHGNLNLDTVFLQHNGLTKIGCVAPDAIHQHVRTCREHVNVRNLHFVAPEYAYETILTPAADIYSFGVLTLEMLIYGIPGVLGVAAKDKEKDAIALATSLNGGVAASPAPAAVDGQPTPSIFPITLEMVNVALETLEEGPVKKMIRDCLNPIAEFRPSAKNLLFDAAFFEVPTLKQIAAFAFVDYFSADHLDNWNDLAVSYGKDTSTESVIAENPWTKQVYRVNQLQNADLDKYLEDIRQGVHPLTAFGVDSPTTSLLTTPAQSTRDEGESYGLGDDFEDDLVNEIETRLVMSCMCTIRCKHDSPVASLELILRMEDKMNRHLMCDFEEDGDSPDNLTEELFDYGLINDQDQDKIRRLIESTMLSAHTRKLEVIQQQLAIPSSESMDLSADARNVEGWDVVIRSAVLNFGGASIPNGANTASTVEGVGKEILPTAPAPLSTVITNTSTVTATNTTSVVTGVT